MTSRYLEFTALSGSNLCAVETNASCEQRAGEEVRDAQVTASSCYKESADG